MTRQGTAEGSAIRIIAHREMLGVVPQRSHSVAVEVTHHERAAVTIVGASRGNRSKGHELIHQTKVKLLLLSHIAVEAVAGEGLGAIVAERINPIRIEVQQSRGKPIY